MVSPVGLTADPERETTRLTQNLPSITIKPGTEESGDADRATMAKPRRRSKPGPDDFDRKKYLGAVADAQKKLKSETESLFNSLRDRRIFCHERKASAGVGEEMWNCR